MWTQRSNLSPKKMANHKNSSFKVRRIQAFMEVYLCQVTLKCTQEFVLGTFLHTDAQLSTNSQSWAHCNARFDHHSRQMIHIWGHHIQFDESNESSLTCSLLGLPWEVKARPICNHCQHIGLACDNIWPPSSDFGGSTILGKLKSRMMATQIHWWAKQRSQVACFSEVLKC